MEVETTLAKSIRAADEGAKYDAACKKLLSEKIILAWILHSCVEEFRGIDVNEIAERYIEGQPQVSEIPVAPDEEAASVISGIGTEDSSINEGTVYYDIRFHALAPKSGELIRLIVNVEAQNDFYPGYPLVKRGLYYCSRMISSQYGTEFKDSRYERIKKVYSIWICMNPPQSRHNTITRYHIAEEDLIGDVKEPEEDYDLMMAVMICLGRPGEKNYGGILKLLDVLFSSETAQDEKQRVLKEDFEISMSQELEREVGLMCNLSEGVWAKGMEKGMEKGTEMTLLENIRNLMDTMKLTAEQAMAALKVPEADRSKYAGML